MVLAITASAMCSYNSRFQPLCGSAPRIMTSHAWSMAVSTMAVTVSPDARTTSSLTRVVVV